MNEIDEQGSKAFQHYLASSSVAINSLTPGFEHGTGVAVRYKVRALHSHSRPHFGERTARRESSDNWEARLCPKRNRKTEIPNAFFHGTKGPVRSSTGIHLKITRRLINKRLGDIAAIKVEDVQRYLPHTAFHDLSNQSEINISEGISVVICGFPGEFALHAQHRVTGQYGVAIFLGFAWQKIVSLSSNLDLSNPMDPHIDFLTDFSIPEHGIRKE